MRTKRALGSTAVFLALMGGVSAVAGIPAASAGTPSMNIDATGGDGTAVDKDGTQGSFTNSVQGVEDSDGDQDARDMTLSEEASPQVKSPNKMSK